MSLIKENAGSLRAEKKAAAASLIDLKPESQTGHAAISCRDASLGESWRGEVVSRSAHAAKARDAATEAVATVNRRMSSSVVRELGEWRDDLLESAL
jgi:hypothetical protein